MGILSIITDVAGQVGQTPRRVKMITTDNLATVTTAGYLNSSNLQGRTIQSTDIIDAWYSYVNGSDPGTYGVFTTSITAGVITLDIDSGGGHGPYVDGDFASFSGTSGELDDLGYSPSDAAKTKVVMAGSAVQVGYLPHFVDVSGTIDDTAGAVINAGNIQAGLSGTAGTHISYPGTASKGSLILAAVANTNNDNVTISNALHGQASVYSIPDGGQATAEFIISDSAGTQHITSGGLQIDAGNVSAGLVTGGTAGKIISYSSTTTSGSLQLAAVANSGAYDVTVSNASHGQSTVYSIPDVGAATGQVLAKTAALVDANFISASGTVGKVVDSGYGENNILRYASVAISAAEFNGMYAAPKLLIEAPGANSLIVIDRAELIMTYVSAAFENGGVVSFQYDSTVNGAGVLASNSEAAADFFQTASTTFAFNGNSGNTVGLMPFSTTVNKGLYLSNLTGAFTTGDSTFICKIHYRIVSTNA